MRANKPVMKGDNINAGGDVDNSQCININSNGVSASRATRSYKYA